jgi:metal-responsive CopG/Arc/MetJ family transcriptional regulator
MRDIRFNMVLSQEEAKTLDRLAKAANRSRSDLIRDAIGIMDAAERRGPGQYVGITGDREAIEVVLIGAR